MTASSRMDLLLAKVGTIWNDSNASVITYLRSRNNVTGQKKIADREGWSENMQKTVQTPRSVQKEKVLQALELKFPAACSAAHGEATVLLKPMEGHEGRDPSAAHGGDPRWSRWRPKRDCGPMGHP
ncbi:hypothetical protein WISP_139892 [Willisornis vidua]|uniref:Uncharacterized protein n=1 Tax=Willisornis vidua TaxID=1566151 RepID=A0ABQ9CMC3_9PASS|nr:hypothetical protein WISP_139892 [Willisornis vidua]